MNLFTAHDGSKSTDKRIKLVALDMDGTLLNEKGVLSPQSKTVLRKSLEHGLHIVIATGRVLNALPEDVICLSGIEYAITSNGAHIIRLRDGRTIYSNLIEKGIGKKLKEIFIDPQIMVEVFFHHEVVAEKRCLEHLETFGMLTDKAKEYTLRTRKPVDDIWRLVEENDGYLENINLIFGNPKKRAHTWERLKQIDDITVTSSMPHNLEIGGKTTSKGNAIVHLAEILKVKKEEIMACGDSENDLSMLEKAGFSVAMGNAVETVKAQADFITLDNAQDGAAYAIRRFCFNEKIEPEFKK